MFTPFSRPPKSWFWICITNRWAEVPPRPNDPFQKRELYVDSLFYMIRLFSLAAIVFVIPCAAKQPELLQMTPLSTFVGLLKRLVWTSAQGVENSGNLLKPKSGQAVLNEPDAPFILKPGAAVVLNFGVEIQGSTAFFTPQTKSQNVGSAQIRFGESVAETVAEEACI